MIKLPKIYRIGGLDYFYKEGTGLVRVTRYLLKKTMNRLHLK